MVTECSITFQCYFIILRQILLYVILIQLYRVHPFHSTWINKQQVGLLVASHNHRKQVLPVFYLPSAYRSSQRHRIIHGIILISVL